MTSDLDTLMARIEEINAKEPPLAANDITDTIAYHRASRSRKASGSKPAAKTPMTPEDLAKIMATVITKPQAAASSSGFKFKVRL